MREAGFEPAHPGIRELKSRGIDQLTDSRVHRNVTVTNFLGTNDLYTPLIQTSPPLHKQYFFLNPFSSIIR
jgi:hypothetical protein